MNPTLEVVAARLRARRRRRLLWLIGGLVALLVLVAALPRGHRSRALTVPTDARIGTAVARGVVQGVARATRTGTRVCFWVDAPAGRVFLVFPDGWSADARLTLRDSAGASRTRSGTVTAFLGRPGPPGAPGGCTGAGRRWLTTDVRLPAAVQRPSAGP